MIIDYSYRGGAHHDAIHAEMSIVTRALARGQNLGGQSLFVSLIPCLNGSRILNYTGLKEIIYMNNHSYGYAVKLLNDVTSLQNRWRHD